MQWAVRQTNNADQEIASAKFPDIRLFYVPRKPSAVPVDDVDARWVVCTPETVKEFSAVLYYFGRQLHQDLKVPIGLIHTSWGGTPIASWISGPALTAAPRLAPFLAFWEDQIANYPDRYTQYQQNLEKWEQNGSKGPRPSTPMGPGNSHQPTTLYNGMIAPLVKYSIKGALWYQGETEAGRSQGHIYGDAMRTLVQDWRKAFGQGEFPFFWVQLANFGNAAKNGHWMRVQEGQVQATDVRSTGVVIINDIGEPADIHPKNKQDVGQRLALLARHVAYGQDGFVWSSPLFRQVTREGKAMRVWFDHAGSGLKTRGAGPVKGFTIAGADGNFVPAEAKIEGITVIVSSSQVAEPQAVRYAWDYNPDANLVNSAGLPAALFRSDSRGEMVVR
jgi:sialate O-acetylesterase